MSGQRVFLKFHEDFFITSPTKCHKISRNIDSDALNINSDGPLKDLKNHHRAQIPHLIEQSSRILLNFLQAAVNILGIVSQFFVQLYIPPTRNFEMLPPEKYLSLIHSNSASVPQTGLIALGFINICFPFSWLHLFFNFFWNQKNMCVFP